MCVYDDDAADREGKGIIRKLKHVRNKAEWNVLFIYILLWKLMLKYFIARLKEHLICNEIYKTTFKCLLRWSQMENFLPRYCFQPLLEEQKHLWLIVFPFQMTPMMRTLNFSEKDNCIKIPSHTRYSNFSGGLF